MNVNRLSVNESSRRIPIYSTAYPMHSRYRNSHVFVNYNLRYDDIFKRKYLISGKFEIKFKYYCVLFKTLHFKVFVECRNGFYTFVFVQYWQNNNKPDDKWKCKRYSCLISRLLRKINYWQKLEARIESKKLRNGHT